MGLLKRMGIVAAAAPLRPVLMGVSLWGERNRLRKDAKRDFVKVREVEIGIRALPARFDQTDLASRR